MNRKHRTHEEFVNELHEINPNIIVLDKFINTKTKINFKCVLDGWEWSTTPSSVLSGTGCPKCGKRHSADKLRKSTEEFVSELSRINPNVVVLGEYISNITPIELFCTTHNVRWFALPSNVLRGYGCPECCKYKISQALKKPYDDFIEKLNEINSNIQIIGEYVDTHTEIKVKCKIDNYEWDIQPVRLLSGVGCPLCAGKVVVQGVNDIATTHPEYVVYFKNKDDAAIYSAGSRQYVDCICPNCGYEKHMKIHHLISDGFACLRCGDGISYPEKFARALLKQLPVAHVQYEWDPDWLKPYFYDNYFEYLGQSYVLEMDGGLSHGDKILKTKDGNITGAERDAYKDALAQQHNVHVIRIDCDYKKDRFEYIKHHIIYSELSVLFDMDTIDWKFCDSFACGNLIKSVCNLYASNNKLTLRNLSDIYHLNHRTIQSYLIKGDSFGWCVYKTKSRTRPVCAININTQEKFEFKSIADCALRLEAAYNHKFSNSYISKICNSDKVYNNFMFYDNSIN